MSALSHSAYLRVHTHYASHTLRDNVTDVHPKKLDGKDFFPFTEIPEVRVGTMEQQHGGAYSYLQTACCPPPEMLYSF